MVLQSFGTITMSQIRSEFKLTGTISLASNGRGIDKRVPQSGTINITNFYAKYYRPTFGLKVWLDAKDSYSGSGSTWNDIQGNANTTLVNSPTWTSPYFSFNGTSQHAAVPSLSGITDFSNTQAYSVSFWFWPSSTQNDVGNGDNDVVEKWTGSTGYPYVFRFIRASNSLSQATWNNGQSSGLGSLTNAITTNAWNHVTGVFNWPGSTMVMYINGVQAAINTSATISGTITNTSPLFLMCRAGSYNYCTGRFSMLFIYDRVLSGTEVSDIYNATRGVVGA